MMGRVQGCQGLPARSARLLPGGRLRAQCHVGAGGQLSRAGPRPQRGALAPGQACRPRGSRLPLLPTGRLGDGGWACLVASGAKWGGGRGTQLELQTLYVHMLAPQGSPSVNPPLRSLFSKCSSCFIAKELGPRGCPGHMGSPGGGRARRSHPPVQGGRAVLGPLCLRCSTA